MSRGYSNFKILKEIETEDDGTKILVQVDVTERCTVKTFLWFTKESQVTRTVTCVKNSGSECFKDVTDGSYMYNLFDLYSAYALLREFDTVDLYQS